MGDLGRTMRLCGGGVMIYRGEKRQSGVSSGGGNNAIDSTLPVASRRLPRISLDCLWPSPGKFSKCYFTAGTSTSLSFAH